MFQIGDAVEIRPVLDTSDFQAFPARVVDNRVAARYPGQGWYVVADATGQEHYALVSVTFAAQQS